jgi:hypothetical protein
MKRGPSSLRFVGMTTKGLRQGLVVSGYDEQKARGNGAASGGRCALRLFVGTETATL